MKRLMKAFLWIVCYGGACWFGIKAQLGFDILLPAHWKALFDKSVHAHWPPEFAAKKLVCKVLLAFIIVGILGLAVVTKKRKTRIPIVKGELPEPGSSRPALIISQKGKNAAVPPPISVQLSGNGGPFSAPAANPPTVNLMADAVRRISDVAKGFEVSVFPHVKLENTFTQLVISDDATALMLKILPQDTAWKVQLTESPEESQWTFEDQPPRNMLKDILESTATLKRLEPESRAVAVVLIVDGIVENSTEVKNYLEQHDIRIATLDNQEMPDVPTWQNLLSEFYPTKTEENKNETDTNEQNM